MIDINDNIYYGICNLIDESINNHLSLLCKEPYGVVINAHLFSGFITSIENKFNKHIDRKTFKYRGLELHSSTSIPVETVIILNRNE